MPQTHRPPRVHLKLSDGWTKTISENWAEGSLVPEHYEFADLPNNRRLRFKLVKVSQIHDYRNHERRVEAWYEELT